MLTLKNAIINEDLTVLGKLKGKAFDDLLATGGSGTGSGSLYYKLNTNGESVEIEQTEYNSLHGSNITPGSLDPTKMNVSDLGAFGATVGGFRITGNSIYSGGKSSPDNSTRGIYLDNAGQFSVGSASNYFKYYKDTDGTYKLAISAEKITIKVGDTDKSVADSIVSVENRKMINVRVVSSEGSALKETVKQTTLTALVYNYNEDITDTLDPSLFNWKRKSLSRINDEYWGAEYGVGKKTVIVTNDDVLEQATFECEVTIV